MPWPSLLLLGYLCLINLIGTVFVIADKYRARRGKWRVPERAFFIVSLLGGTAGTYLCMRAIRHKTLHKRFMIGLPVIFILQIAAVAAFFVLRYANIVK